MDQFQYDLERLGLSQNEATVYLTLLQMGSGTVRSVAERAKIKRTTMYSILEALREKGLVLEKHVRGEGLYIAESPEQLHQLLELQQREVERRRRVADPLIERLRVFHNAGAVQPKIRYVETIDGLRAMQREYECMQEDILQIVGFDTLRQLHDPTKAEEHGKILSGSGRKIRTILVTRESVEYPDSWNIEYRRVSPDAAPIEGEMTVCGDRLALFSYTSGLVAVEIVSPTIAQTARMTLEMAWSALYDRKK